MKRFKEEYQNCTIHIRTQYGRKTTIDSRTVDPNKFAAVPGFEHLFEDAPKPEKKTKAKEAELIKEMKEEIKKVETEVNIETTKDEAPLKELSELTLKELRAKFPDIVAKSKADFLKQLGQ